MPNICKGEWKYSSRLRKAQHTGNSNRLHSPATIVLSGRLTEQMAFIQRKEMKLKEKISTHQRLIGKHPE